MRVSKHPQQRRAELVLAARQLFDQNGVQNTRISDIVKRVGVAQGVFYYYFKSKEEMVREVARQVGEEMERKSASILNNREMDFCQKLSGLIELFMQLGDQFLEDGATHLPAEAVTNFTPAAQSAGLLVKSLMSLVERGAAEGAIATSYPRETVTVLLHGFWGAARQALPSMAMVYAITQQALGITDDRLVALYRKKHSEKQTV